MRKFSTAAAVLALVWLAAALAPGSGAADGNAVDAVFRAIGATDLPALKTLVAAPADANVRDQAGVTPLMYAGAAGSLDAMTLLLDKGADVNAQNGFGSTALVWSATQIDKVRLLLERGA